MRTPREPVQDTLPGHAAVARVPLLRRAAPDQAQRVVRRLAGQLPFFAAASADPIAGDLSGLLIGPGQVVRMGGTARVSIVVDAPCSKESRTRSQEQQRVPGRNPYCRPGSDDPGPHC